jgi:predicted RNA-binding protein with EMAP domain
VAFLPPREVGGTASEAMFLGEERRTEPPGTVLEESAVDVKEALSILHDEVARR